MEKRTLLEKTSSLIDRDKKQIWHPFRQAQTERDPILIKRAKGALLYTEDNVDIIDAISSWWVTLHGHGHPYIQEAIKSQLEKFEHVMFADFTHEAGIQLAEKIISLLPEGFSRVFYSDNGSTAVEKAVKITFQYWYNKNANTKKKKVIAFRNGYHGDTFGAMSLTERSLFSDPFSHVLFDVEYIDPPIVGEEQKSIKQLEALLMKEDCSCFIFEPLIQGVGGMKTHSTTGLDALIALCRHYQVFTIADEVMTGLGRTGPNFAIEKLKQSSDFICLAKGLTGGFLPLGVTVCKEEVYEAFLSDKKEKAFLDGHSYAGNPLACSAGLASLELLETEKCQKQRMDIELHHQQFLTKLKKDPRIARVEVLGTILAIDYQSTSKTSYFNSLRDELFSYFQSQKVWIRPFGNTIHLMPPYCITQSQLSKLYQAIEGSLEIRI